jgi:hypothetical protein
MGRGRIAKPSQASSHASLEFITIPHILSEEEDNERIKELARKITGVIESARKAKKRKLGKADQLRDELFGAKSEEKFLGLG